MRINDTAYEQKHIEHTNSNSSPDDENDAASIWAPDVEKAFEDAMTIYPSVGRRKICIDGSMYGRNELIVSTWLGVAWAT